MKRDQIESVSEKISSLNDLHAIAVKLYPELAKEQEVISPTKPSTPIVIEKTQQTQTQPVLRKSPSMIKKSQPVIKKTQPVLPVSATTKPIITPKSSVDQKTSGKRMISR